MNKKVGLVTWHYYENVGSNLQAYALFTYIKKMGYDVSFINYQYKKFQDSWIKNIMKKILIFLDRVVPVSLPNKFTFKYLQFQNNFFKKTGKVFTMKQLLKFNDYFDAFVCGSDQIWSPIVFDEKYFLNFVESKYKFSYAPSIGSENIPTSLIPRYKELLSSFNGISVREKKGKELLKSIGINSEVVLDPTFLLTEDDWKNISCERLEKNDYIFCYFLGENSVYKEKVYEFAKKNKKKIIIYSNNASDIRYCDRYVTKIGPREFLSYILYSYCVFTDSFHGIAVSLKFKKLFNAFYRFKDSDNDNQNSRVINIMEIVGLMDRLIDDDESLNLNSINYDNVMYKLNKEIIKSKIYLDKHLKEI